MKYLLLSIVVLFSSDIQAQPGFPPPTGVFCSCGPTTGNGYGSVNPTIASKPFVKGILVRVGWDILEPSDNSYKWALIDTQINRARQYGKKISLGIGSGIHIPEWVFDNGAQRLITSAPYNDTIAVPWDGNYLNKWEELIAALGNRYQNDTVIQLVYMTHSTANGFEMQLPMSVSPTLSAIGYTDKKMSDSWKKVIDAFDTHFPNHYLSNDFHPVNNSNDVADTVYQYATTTIGKRYGAAAWWWTQKNTGVYPAQYDIMKSSVKNNSFSVVQFAKSGTADSALFGPGGMPGAIELAVKDGICYWEIWNDDILNPKFDSLLSNTNCVYTSIDASVSINKLTIYPNPTNGRVTVSMPQQSFYMHVKDITGQVLYTIDVHNKDSVELNMTNKPKGIYLVIVNSKYGATHGRIVVQ